MSILQFMDIRGMRQKHGVSLRELEYVSGVPRPTIHAIEKKLFALSADKEARIKVALELIAEHKRAWRELPKQLARRLKEQSRRRED